MEDKILAEVRQCNGAATQQIQALANELGKLANLQSKKKVEDEAARERDRKDRQALVDKWLERNEIMINSLVDRVQKTADNQKQDSYRRKVLDSLYFEQIEQRQNMIDEKYQKTLSWVFDPPAEYRSLWSEVPEWLEGSDGIYWVGGKAGSGKSTLMKWLLHHERTKQLLEVWSAKKELLTLSYFFWSPGSETQKSLTGLLRSLLFDLLRQRPEIIRDVSPARWGWHDLELAHFPLWTTNDLLYSIRTAVEITSLKTRFCLFIDGLDEFVGEDYQRNEVLDFLKDLSARPSVKICVSSRPWDIFVKAFASCPQLHLDKLTRHDIENYISSKLIANQTFETLKKQDEALHSRLVSKIRKRAEGVWLWVILVVRSLLQGLQNGDTFSDLNRRLKAIPKELENLFQQMTAQMDSFYRPKTLRLLKTVLAVRSPPPALMTLYFIDHYQDDANFAFTFRTEVTPEEVAERWLEEAARRVNIRCLGLLEVVSYNPNRSHSEHLFVREYVDFLHRSARDFLNDPKTQDMLDMKSASQFDVDLFMCYSLLTQIKISVTPLSSNLRNLMHHATRLEQKASPLLMPLLSHLNEVLGFRKGHKWTYEALAGPIESEWSVAEQGRVPLLSLAIQRGLSTYAIRTMKNSPGVVRTWPGRPLLDYALRRGIYSLDTGQAEQVHDPVKSWAPSIDTVQQILELGADPNEQCGKSTVWRLFMEYLDVFAEDFRKAEVTVLQQWLSVVELMISYGAARILESDTFVPNRLSGRTRVRLITRQKFARDSINAAFGSKEAERLESLAWWRSVTGQNVVTGVVRTISSLW